VIPTVLLANDDDAVRSMLLALQNNLRRVYMSMRCRSTLSPWQTSRLAIEAGYVLLRRIQAWVTLVCAARTPITCDVPGCSPTVWITLGCVVQGRAT
jgi:hypothetical protein